MATKLEELLGTSIITSGDEGSIVATSTFASKKQIFLYFSAHWCPPCRRFTPILSKAYTEYKEKVGDEAEVEVIFVSSDNNETDFKEYRAEMTFPAIPFDKDRSESLGNKLGVRGYPSIVVIDGNGDTIKAKEDELLDMISAYGADAFIPERVEEIKKEEMEKKTESLKCLSNGQIPFIVKNDEKDEETSFQTLLTKSEYVGLLLGDGDASDAGYDEVSDVMKKVNGDVGGADKMKCPMIYLGWSLYDSDSDHSKLSNKFDFAVGDVPKELRDAVGYVIGKEKAQMAPQLILLRQGTGMCSIDGTCEDADSMVVVTIDQGLGKVRSLGFGSFPWDEAAVKKFEEAKKAKQEELKANMTDFKFLTDPESDGSSLLLSSKGQESLKDQLFVGDDEGVVGLYFSAHWCPPCKMFTPKLVETYEKLKEQGKKFEIIFVSSDSSKEEFEEYYGSMVTSKGDKFLALDYDQKDLKSNLSEMFNVQGIPSLVLLKSDGTLITEDGRDGLGRGGTEAFPWDKATVERVASERKAALLEQEKKDEETQAAAGGAIVKRISGAPTEISHDVAGKTVKFEQFTTVGAPNMVKVSGVMYYELEILNQDHCPQLGFSTKLGMELSNTFSGEGVGDNTKSWSVDGARSVKWHGGDNSWSGTWEVGNIIGLAANIDAGMIAVSKDGNWAEDGYGIVFNDESIKEGVYPCFTSSDTKLRYCFDEADFKYGPPSESIWNKSE